MTVENLLQYEWLFQTGLSGGLETLCGQAYGAPDVPHAGPVPAVGDDPVGGGVRARLRAVDFHGATAPAAGPRGVPQAAASAAAFVASPASSRSPSCSACSGGTCRRSPSSCRSSCCSAVPFALHVALAHPLANVLGMGLAGASAAISAAFWASCLMQLAYVLRSEPWRRRSATAKIN
ncbi:hypothetical protein BDA96_03G334900 [Sorghum bicolor]|uniref:Uncharacterized protein n=1 Tax=Sorghum bicolor TaxID=4558 RepID=A0A921UPB3_SORBI|nr:hypothetical protein BDA96_03G334900 [Sorghum bicolor]